MGPRRRIGRLGCKRSSAQSLLLAFTNALALFCLALPSFGGGLACLTGTGFALFRRHGLQACLSAFSAQFGQVLRQQRFAHDRNTVTRSGLVDA